MRICYKVFTHIFMLVCHFGIVTWSHVTEEEVNNYEEYLGNAVVREQQMIESWVNHSTEKTEDAEDGPEQPMIPIRGRGPVSTVVSNHIGWFDILALICSPMHCGFTPKIQLANAPLVSSLALGLQSLFVDRGEEGARDAVVDQIVKR